MVRSSSEKQTTAADFVSISAANHQKRRVVLPDVSKVWLNSDAELRYPKAFTEKTRVVYLSGEDHDYPMLYDSNYNPKPAYKGFLDAGVSL